MFVPWWALNRRHSTTTLCVQGAERKYRRIAEQEAWEGAALDFKAYVQHLESLSLFRYLAQILTEVDYDWTAIVTNL